MISLVIKPAAKIVVVVPQMQILILYLISHLSSFLFGILFQRKMKLIKSRIYSQVLFFERYMCFLTTAEPIYRLKSDHDMPCFAKTIQSK